MEEYDFVTPVRVEPNVGYPESVDKILIDFGKESQDFKENDFIKWHEDNIEKNKDRVEQRMFFQWMINKKLYNEIGGNDELFSKYMVDDDDFYLRVKQSGAKYTQVFESEDGCKEIWTYDKTKYPYGPLSVEIKYPKQYKTFAEEQK